MQNLSIRNLSIIFTTVILFYISFMSYYYINELTARSNLIYTQNYQSLVYSFNIYKELSFINQKPDAIQNISDNIKLQAANITETGEKTLTDSLKFSFDMILQTNNNLIWQQKTEQLVSAIFELNSQAIKSKINFATNKLQTVLFWVAIQLFFALLIIILFIYLYYKIDKSNHINKLKSNFIADVSHELKTPISTIQLSIQLLQNIKIGILNPSQAELTNHIKDDCNRLLKIVNELLNLSQLETGKLSLNIQNTSIKKILDYVCKTIELPLKQKQISLIKQVSDDLANVFIDEEKTAWILINLLSNAIRYSPAKNKIEISTIQLNNYVEIGIKDYGKGIEKQYQHKIFERYFQIKSDKADSGTAGIGLAISKEFAIAQGGNIIVESEQGLGTTFKLSLPVNKAIFAYQ